MFKERDKLAFADRLLCPNTPSVGHQPAEFQILSLFTEDTGAVV